MNAPQLEIITRKADQERVRQLFEDFKAAEQPTVEAFMSQMESLFRELLPRMQGYAIQSGTMKQKATFKLEMDLTPGHRSIHIYGVNVPPPCTVEKSTGIAYVVTPTKH